MIGDFEWWALVCVLGAIVLGIAARFIGPVLADIFCGRVGGGRK